MNLTVGQQFATAAKEQACGGLQQIFSATWAIIGAPTGGTIFRRISTMI